MASGEQTVEQKEEEQEEQEAKAIPQATPIAAGPQPPYDEDFNPFSEEGIYASGQWNGPSGINGTCVITCVFESSTSLLQVYSVTRSSGLAYRYPPPRRHSFCDGAGARGRLGT